MKMGLMVIRVWVVVDATFAFASIVLYKVLLASQFLLKVSFDAGLALMHWMLMAHRKGEQAMPSVLGRV